MTGTIQFVDGPKTFDGDDAAADRIGTDQLDLAQRAGCEGICDGGSRQQRDAEASFDHALCGLDVVDLGDASRDNPGLPQRGIRDVVLTRGSGEQDQLHVSDLSYVNSTSSCERMVRSNDEYELIFVQGEGCARARRESGERFSMSSPTVVVPDPGVAEIASTPLLPSGFSVPVRATTPSARTRPWATSPRPSS